MTALDMDIQVKQLLYEEERGRRPSEVRMSPEDLRRLAEDGRLRLYGMTIRLVEGAAEVTVAA